MLELIAELSCNHLGELDRALALVNAAAAAGCDAVKFQCWTTDTIVTDDRVIPAGPWAGRRAKELYDEAWTPWEWFPELAQRAKEVGIGWFSSVLDLEALEFLETIGCPRYKIPSFELTDLNLISAVAKKGRPMIISTGMGKFIDIARAVRAAKGADLTLLHCISAYPAPPEDCNLMTMCQIRKDFAVRVGFSDHTLGIGAAVASAVLGASMIEKHLTLLRADGGPDAEFSLEPDEMKQLVTECRRAVAATGPASYERPVSEIYTDLRRGPNGRGS